VASGELSLVKLREKIDGRPTRRPPIEELGAEVEEPPVESGQNGHSVDAPDDEETRAGWTGQRQDRASSSLTEDSLVQARHDLADAVEELVGVLRAPDVVRSIPETDRANLAKYLTIAKLKLENAIAMVRSGDSGE
jgi:hypothetical protein